jgi:subtilisin-like proprotein convertase family protein
MNQPLRHALLPLFSLLLVACGGGGGGSANPPGDTLAAPTGLTASAHTDGVLLNWGPVAGAENYAIFVGNTAGFALGEDSFLGVAEAPPVVIGGFPAAGQIYFKVTALKGELSSGPSNEVGFNLGGGTGGGGGNDPLLPDQWHLSNTGQAGGTPGEDARVLPAWNAGLKGQGIYISVVDDGLEIGHVDLVNNVVPGLSYDYVDLDDNPTGGEHGTSVAGVSAAQGGNPHGGAGVAPAARLAGFNFLQNSTTANEVDAMLRGLDVIDVSNNSWGPGSNGIPVPAAVTWKSAIDQGLSNGRGGRGLNYVFAAGNGGVISKDDPTPMEDANLLGYQSYYGVIAVAAVGDDGKQAYYSNPGACVLVAAPSLGRADHGITTTDRSGAEGYNTGNSPGNYANPAFTNAFDGTSSAAPLVSGVVALMLERNPQLTWRDVRLILARTARRNDPSDLDWKQNGAGLWTNHKYGFGVVDAAAATAMAANFPSVGGSSMLESVGTSSGPLNLPIPDGVPTWVTSTLTLGNGPGPSKIESVEVSVKLEHDWIGDLEIILVSPQGTESVLSRPHFQPDYGPGFQNWTFSTVRCLDEPVAGVWTLRVRDLYTPDAGLLKEWRVTVRGS